MARIDYVELPSATAHELTRAFYGKDFDFRTLLTGKVPAPAQAHDFLASVRHNFREANAEK